jgi:hypothetical protein
VGAAALRPELTYIRPSSRQPRKTVERRESACIGHRHQRGHTADGYQTIQRDPPE